MRNDLPKRRKNRLEKYDYSRGGGYFLTICTKDKKNIFWQKNQPEVVGEDIILPPESVRLTDWGRVAEQAIQAIPKHYPHISVEQYVIMPNHIHLLLMVQRDNWRMISSPTGMAAKIENSADAEACDRSSSPASVLTAVGQMKRFVSKKVGTSIWQRSFHDHIIRDFGDYTKISRYIYENPTKWKEDCFYIPDDGQCTTQTF